VVPALDPVPAKCIISSLIKDLLTLISMVPALDPAPTKCIIGSLIKDLLTLISMKNA
jgi:hypothetical protein